MNQEEVEEKEDIA